jgi:hypothetical protein
MAVLTAAKGLVTDSNALSNPNGSLVVADNVVVDSDNIIQQRRGYKDWATLTSQTKQLLSYKGRILAHYSNKLSFDSNNNGNFVDFLGTYLELETGLRIKGIEANGNFYFTTSEGIKKISAKTTADLPSTVITRAGGIKAIDLSSKIVIDSSGFLPAQSKVAYRLVFGTKDRNDNVIPGYPSPRSILTNTSSDINQSEKFTISVLNHAGITNSEYFLFDVKDIGYFVWFEVSGSATEPSTADTLSRQGIKVNLQGTSTDAEAAARIANELSATVEGITVEIALSEITVTIISPGDVADVSQGTVSDVDLKVTKIFDGSITAGAFARAELNFTIPDEITTDYYYQIYRTAVTTVSTGLTLNDIDPGDEMNLIIETPITSADITAGQITVADNTPEGFRQVGAFLYTNPVTGGGILSANERPPIATDLALFRNSMFYANTKDIHRLELNFLSVDDFVSGSTKFTVAKGDKTTEYTFVGDVEVTEFIVLPKSQTVAGTYIELNSAENQRQYYLWFDKGNISHSFNATTAVNDITEEITITNHGYATNDKVTFSGVLPGGLSPSTNYYIIRINANTFQVAASPGGPAINLTDAVGTCTVSLVSVDPAIISKQGIRVPLELYSDDLTGSKQALIDSLSDFEDFVAASTGADVVTVTCTDTGFVTDPVISSPAPGWTVSVVAQGDGEDVVAKEALLSVNASTAISIDTTVRSLIKVLNRDSDCPITATYLSGPDDLPGKVLLEAKELDNEKFYVAINSSSLSSEFNPELPSTIVLSSINSTTNVFTTTLAHGLTAGTEIYINDNPGGVPTEFAGVYTIATTPAVNQFTLVGVDVGINQPGPLSGLIFRTTASSDNNEAANRIYYSKVNQPEAVPIINYIDVGPKDKKILRILALRDNLFALKEDGVYIVTGPSAPNFSVRLLDNSTLITAPDTAAVLNNLIYVLSNQGVVSISDSGISVVSGSIDDTIRKVTTFAYNYYYSSFAVSYESDRAYVVWLPTTKQDNKATQAFRYNTFTNTWTRWIKTNTCGIIKNSDDRMYLGSGTRPTIEQERKNDERQDYADRDFGVSIGAGAISNLDITLSSSVGVTKGDCLVQEQYVTITKFNRLLKKLDSDSGTADSDYYSTLKVDYGSNMGNVLLTLVAKLNSDTGLGTFTIPSGSNALLALKADYNAMIDELNSPFSGTSLKDYKKVTELITYEVVVQSVKSTNNIVTVNFMAGFIQGDARIFKMIPVEVIWAPQHFGTPEQLKQVHEGTILFEKNNIYSATIGYSSDRSADFTDIEFPLKGPGFWSSFVWADAVFGGAGNSVPLRTLIPQNKSRCRYLNVKFKHSNARESFKLLGISLEPRVIGSRGYR